MAVEFSKEARAALETSGGRGDGTDGRRGCGGMGQQSALQEEPSRASAEEKKRAVRKGANKREHAEEATSGGFLARGQQPTRTVRRPDGAGAGSDGLGSGFRQSR
jgi:hypothetical protein